MAGTVIGFYGLRARPEQAYGDSVTVMPFYLEQCEAITPGLRRIAYEQIDKALHLGADEAVPLADRAHYLRLCCKKLRGVLRLARPLLGDTFHAADDKFRSAAKQLADFRDKDVIATTGEFFGAAAGENAAGPGAQAEAAIARCMAVLRECRNDIGNWSLAADDFDDIAPGFRRTYRHCLDAWDAVLRDPTDANFHVLRRRTKYHWYHVRILERLDKKKIRPRRRALRELQLALGNAHDLVMLQSAQGASEHADRELLRQTILRKWRLYEKSMNVGAEVYSLPAGRLVSEFSRMWARRRVDHQRKRSEHQRDTAIVS